VGSPDSNKLKLKLKKNWKRAWRSEWWWGCTHVPQCHGIK